MIRRFLVAVTLAATVAPLAAQDDANAPRMQGVMSATELRETGVASLSPAQRAELDAWLERYTAIIERAASRGAQAAGDPGAPAAEPSAISYSGPLAVPYGSRIADVKEGGTYIVLADETWWEVYLPNRPATTTWAKGDYLIVASRPVEQNGEFFFQLINGRDGTSAAVKWRGKGQVPSRSP